MSWPHDLTLASQRIHAWHVIALKKICRTCALHRGDAVLERHTQALTPSARLVTVDQLFQIS